MSTKRLALASAGVAIGLLLVPATAAFAAPSSQDSTYLKAAHQSNLAEIAGGKIAQQKGTSKQVKDLATRFITDHTKLDAALTKTAAGLDVTLPDAPNAEQQAVAARYQATSGQQFDTLYISTQMTAHMKAMALGETEVANGTDAQAKKAATDAAPVVASHHSALEAAARDLGVPDSINTGTGGLAAHRTIRSSSIALVALGILLIVGAALVLRRRRTILG